MRNISFSLTTAQFKDGSKDITRRLGWDFLNVNDHLMACEKCQGIKRGESIVRLGPIQVISITREPLSRMITDPKYGKAEAIREGFPDLTGQQFVEMFCRHMKCQTATRIARIEFKRIQP